MRRICSSIWWERLCNRWSSGWPESRPVLLQLPAGRLHDLAPISLPGLAQQFLQALPPVILLFSLQFEISSLRILRIELQYADGSLHNPGKILGLPLLANALQQNLNLSPRFQNTSRVLAKSLQVSMLRLEGETFRRRSITDLYIAPLFMPACFASSAATCSFFLASRAVCACCLSYACGIVGPNCNARSALLRAASSSSARNWPRPESSNS
jgi:hypothetical protein